MDHLWIDSEQQDEPPHVPYLDPGNLKYFYDEEDSWMKLWDANIDEKPDIMCQEGLFFRTIARWLAVMNVAYRREFYVKGDRLSLIMLQDLCRILIAVTLLEWHPGNEALIEDLASQGTTLDIADTSNGGDRWLQLKMIRQSAKHDREALLLNIAALLSSSTSALATIEPKVAWSRLFACEALHQIVKDCTSAIVGETAPLPAIGRSLVHAVAAVNGICPQRLRRLQVPSDQLIASTMRHQYGHHNCEKSRCLAIPPALPLHRNCIGCEVPTLRPVELQKLKLAINTTGYGLLQFHEHLEVVTSDRYIAISHVWKHGLGNPGANALPECQLKHLKKFVNGNPFWIDTLCIPHGEDKMRALHKMADVYKLAALVIVLDNDLLKVRGDLRLKQIALLTCDWITRLWTLQEALLPRDVRIAFADGLVPLRTLLDHLGPLLEHDVPHHLATRISNRPPLWILPMISPRVTTYAEDEGICASILLGVEIGADFPAAVQQLKEVDQNLTFVPGKRCSRSGMKWCPETILCQHSFPLPQPRPLGCRGLQMKKAVLTLGPLYFDGRPITIGDQFVATVREDTLHDALPLSLQNAIVICERSSESFDRLGVDNAVLADGVIDQAHYTCGLWLITRRYWASYMAQDDQVQHIHIKDWQTSLRELWLD